VSSSPPSGSESHSPKNGERRKGWWDKKEKEKEKDKEKEKEGDEGKKESKWRSRSKRLLRKKGEGDAITELAGGDKITAVPRVGSDDNNDNHEGESAINATERDTPAAPAAVAAADEEVPSEGEDEEDIRGEEDDALKTKAAAVSSDACADADALGKGKSSDQLDQSVREPESEGVKASVVVAAAKRPRGLTGSERRPSVVAKTVKMAMEEELLSRVKERAPDVVMSPGTSSCSSSLGVGGGADGGGGGGGGDDCDGEEEEDELFFSEANEAVVIQRPQKDDA
jgi:hypothetical protein